MILDDVWSSEIWGCGLKVVFLGDEDKDLGSKILFIIYSR